MDNRAPWLANHNTDVSLFVRYAQSGAPGSSAVPDISALANMVAAADGGGAAAQMQVEAAGGATGSTHAQTRSAARGPWWAPAAVKAMIQLARQWLDASVEDSTALLPRGEGVANCLPHVPR